VIARREGMTMLCSLSETGETLADVIRAITS
jgi:hypothetical protein